MPFDRRSRKGLTYPYVGTATETQELATLVDGVDDYLREQWATDAATTSGLTYGYKGGVVYDGAAYSRVEDGTVALVASTTNYVERDNAGAVTVNQAGFTAGQQPMATVTTDAQRITAMEDWRTGETQAPGTGLPGVHVLATTAGLGPQHSTSGLTAGQVLKATAAAAAAFAFLSFAEITGSVAAGQVPVGAVTQHEAALTILEAQITDGTILARLAASETITGLYTFSNASGLLTDVVGERTAAAGVTVDGLLIKDAGIPAAAVTAHQAALSILASRVTGATDGERTFASSGKYTFSGALDVGGAATVTGLATFSGGSVSRGQDTSELGLAAAYAADPETGVGVTTPLLAGRSRTGQNIYQLGVTNSVLWLSEGGTADALRLLTVGVGPTTLTVAQGVSISNLLQVTRTSEQARLRYDATNYLSVTVASNGLTTYDAVGAGAKHLFSDDVDVASTKVYRVNGTQVVGAQATAIADADGTLADITTKFNDLLAKNRTHGLIAT